MTYQATLVIKTLAANLATVVRRAVVLRARGCFNRGRRAVGFLLDFLPRMDGIRYRRVRGVVEVEIIVA